MGVLNTGIAYPSRASEPPQPPSGFVGRGSYYTMIFLCCVFVLFRLSSFCVLFPLLTLSLDCSFSTAPSVFFKAYLPVFLDCQLLIAPSVFSIGYLPVSLDCSFCNAPSVFSNVLCACLLNSFNFAKRQIIGK